MTQTISAKDVHGDADHWPATINPLPSHALPAGYRIWLGLTILALVLLLLGVGGFFSLVVFLVIWHLYQATVTWGDPAFVVYHLPISMLGALLLIMVIKPFVFRQPPAQSAAVVLEPDAHPRLFSVVQAIATAASTRVPDAIEVDCTPNASARLAPEKGGRWPRRLVLRVGLPLAASMSARQFAGVIGHELGHFRQRTGMHVSLGIRALGAIVAGIVYQRDRIDLMLLRLGQHPGATMRVLSKIITIPVECGRGVLWIMLTITEAVICRLCRGMEYDADMVEAHIAGDSDFAASCRKLSTLDCAWQVLGERLVSAWGEQRMPRDIPELTAMEADRLLKRLGDAPFARAERAPTRWFDTHPSAQQRIAAVRAAAPAPALDSGPPASDLFGDFQSLCMQATRGYYMAIDPESAGKLHLVPSEEFLAAAETYATLSDTLDRFTQGFVVQISPALPRRGSNPFSEAEARAFLQQAREQLMAACDTNDVLASQYAGAYLQWVSAAAANQAAKALPTGEQGAEARKATRQNLQAAESDLELIQAQVRGLSQTLQARLTVALSSAPEARLSGNEAAPLSCMTRDQILHWADLHLHWRDDFKKLNIVLLELDSLEGLVREVPQLRGEIVLKMDAALQRARELMSRCADAWVALDDPFAERGKARPLGALWSMPDFHKQHTPAEVIQSGLMLIDGYYTFGIRLMAEACAAAERFECTIGLPPLPVPDRQARHEEARQQEDRAARQQQRSFMLGYTVRGAFGTGMLATLLWLSIAPPALPDFSSGGHFRPAPLRGSFNAYVAVRYDPADRPQFIPTVHFQRYLAPQLPQANLRQGAVQLPPGFAPQNVPGGVIPQLNRPGFPGVHYPQPGQPQHGVGPGQPSPYPPGGANAAPNPYRPPQPPPRQAPGWQPSRPGPAGGQPSRPGPSMPGR